MKLDTTAHFSLSVPYALRLIDRTNVYDANVFASQMQTELNAQLGPAGVAVTVGTFDHDTYDVLLDLLVPDNSEDISEALQAAWGAAVDTVIINYWL